MVKHKKFSENEKRQMAEDYKDGDSLSMLATKHGVSIPTMARHVRAGGGAVRKRGMPKREAETLVTGLESVLMSAKIDISEPVIKPAPARILLPVG